MSVPPDWQSLAAVGVVGVTLALFVARSIRLRRKGKSAGLGCSSGGCGCGKKLTGK